LQSTTNALEEVTVRFERDSLPDTTSLQVFLGDVGRSPGLRKLALDAQLVEWHIDDADVALSLLAAVEENPTLEDVEVELSPNLDSIAKKVRFQLKVNRFRRSLSAYPLALWPRVLDRICAPEDCSVRYHFLRPQIGKFGREHGDSKKRVRTAATANDSCGDDDYSGAKHLKKRGDSP